MEGFSNWETDFNFNWNSLDVGPNRDLLGKNKNIEKYYFIFVN